MSKRKDDEQTRLERENRELKIENRALRKRLKKVDRHYEEALENEKKEAFKEEGKKFAPKKCAHCGRGEIVVTDLLGRKFERCTTCDYKARQTSKT